MNLIQEHLKDWMRYEGIDPLILNWQIKVGDTVRTLDKASYGWAGVKPGEEGVVIGVTISKVFINFPDRRTDSWHAKRDEVELVL